MNSGKYFSVLLFLFFNTLMSGQGTLQTVVRDPFSNPVILSHYTASELQQLSPQKLNAITYYYTQSYILDSIACNECRTFDRVHFDVSQFEQFRKQDERFIREYYKYGYRLTLLSRDELEFLPVR
jgi:hypothetical protein